jgi:RNA polymerase sigma factor (sigma-70 family)
MNALPEIVPMSEQDRRITAVMAEQGSRLRNFIRNRVPNTADVEDLLQDVFAELVEANQRLMPIDSITGWLYGVARNRITDLFRKKKPMSFDDAMVVSDEGEVMRFEDLLPSPDAGPEALLLRGALLKEMELALAELPADQRDVFIAHEFEGQSFKELSARIGVSINTLLSRKRYAVMHLRKRLRHAHDQFTEK